MIFFIKTSLGKVSSGMVTVSIDKTPNIPKANNASPSFILNVIFEGVGCMQDSSS